jgi:hypothetical protein
MTIAVALKVHDGLVLAADSASTLIETNPAGQQIVINVYNNANKVYNLYKGLPIGGVTWGLGAIGKASISTLVKDLRARFVNGGPDWKLDSATYTIEEVATKARKFFFEEHYQPLFGAAPTKPVLGFLVAGYSAGQHLPEAWRVLITPAGCSAPEAVQKRDEDTGVYADGQPEAIIRLMLGYGTELPSALKSVGVPDQWISSAVQTIQSKLAVPFVVAGMPIQDAIDVAEFFVYLTSMYSRFTPGAPTVGGPTEIAAITKHEGFKWVKRKYYYQRDINPE